MYSGHGHNRITIVVNGKLSYGHGEEIEVLNHTLKCISNNTMATDVYFDDEYDEYLQNEGNFIECRYEAAEELVGEVLRKNDVISSYVITTVMTPDEVKELRQNLKETR